MNTIELLKDCLCAIQPHSTGAASLILGRRFTGCEIKKNTLI